ncbi:MAG: hypothetical protein GYA87_05265 [Christensenellaceae bacterium]|nr:hypothetical protein [Christensenellaceae bacterium]
MINKYVDFKGKKLNLDDVVEFRLPDSSGYEEGVVVKGTRSYSKSIKVSDTKLYSLDIFCDENGLKEGCYIRNLGKNGIEKTRVERDIEDYAKYKRKVTKAKNVTKQVPTEAQEQVDYFKWARLAACKYKELNYAFAIPNGGSRHVLEAKNLKLQGVKSGVPDICIPAVRNDHAALFIEMKRQKKSVISKEQEDMINYLNANGYKAVIAYGFQEAINETMKYLNS